MPLKSLFSGPTDNIKGRKWCLLHHVCSFIMYLRWEVCQREQNIHRLHLWQSGIIFLSGQAPWYMLSLQTLKQCLKTLSELCGKIFWVPDDFRTFFAVPIITFPCSYYSTTDVVGDCDSGPHNFSVLNTSTPLSINMSLSSGTWTIAISHQSSGYSSLNAQRCVFWPKM